MALRHYWTSEELFDTTKRPENADYLKELEQLGIDPQLVMSIYPVKPKKAVQGIRISNIIWEHAKKRKKTDNNNKRDKRYETNVAIIEAVALTIVNGMSHPVEIQVIAADLPYFYTKVNLTDISDTARLLYQKDCVIAVWWNGSLREMPLAYEITKRLGWNLAKTKELWDKTYASWLE